MRIEDIYILPYYMLRGWDRSADLATIPRTRVITIVPTPTKQCFQSSLLLLSPLKQQQLSPSHILSYFFPSTKIFSHLERCPECAILWGKTKLAKTVCLIEFYLKNKQNKILPPSPCPNQPTFKCLYNRKSKDR